MGWGGEVIWTKSKRTTVFPQDTFAFFSHWSNNFSPWCSTCHFLTWYLSKVWVTSYLTESHLSKKTAEKHMFARYPVSIQQWLLVPNLDEKRDHRKKTRKHVLWPPLPTRSICFGPKWLVPHIVLHVLCSTRTYWGHFRPSKVTFSAIVEMSSLLLRQYEFWKYCF